MSSDSFQRLKHIAPVFSDKARQIAHTQNSLVIDMGDGTILKAIIHPSYPIDPEIVLNGMGREIEALEHFDGRVGYFQAPKLKEFKMFDVFTRQQSGFLGYIRQSRVDGVTLSAFQEQNVTLSPDVYRQLGHLIGEMHQTGQSISSASQSSNLLGLAVFVPESMRGSEIWNNALKLSRWMARHSKKSYVHGDINPENYLLSPDGQDVLSVIDFAQSGYHANHLIDFCYIKKPEINHVLKGYRDVWAQAVDPTLLAITKLSGYSTYVFRLEDDPTKKGEFDKRLAELDHDIKHYVTELRLY